MSGRIELQDKIAELSEEQEVIERRLAETAERFRVTNAAKDNLVERVSIAEDMVSLGILSDENLVETKNDIQQRYLDTTRREDTLEKQLASLVARREEIKEIISSLEDA